ncbi:hypothetical protein PYW07_010939 [Mythimna separata]|uniref:Glucose-methanol-choline oxidoreductase C-terminal domain-containing protein n=1 Tax=Mythimna separata TaxID=271217 RepID=A0AAD7Y8G7_MYTSE|nr:hypothetical protein PYW07_010939 [Mythimna separata]
MGASLSNELLTLAQIPFTMLTATGVDKSVWPKQATIQNNATYDFIVIGGGTAGSVVATRLAESGTDSVMVLEEGGDPPFLAMIAYYFDEIPNSPVDRNYTSTRDPYAARGNNNYTKELETEPAGLDLPECAGKKKGSDEFWECYVLEHTHSPYHSVGTCPMGKVVDSKLRVIGMQKLRVVDASVMPKIPRSSPNAAVIMVAEKASDIIKNDNRNV